MTLPSRLRPRNGRLASLDSIASALNINGGQNIAKLRMSVDADESDALLKKTTTGGERDSRIRGAANGLCVDNEPVTLDMDFFPAEVAEQRGRQRSNKTHVFGQAENSRGENVPQVENLQPELDSEEGHARARRRAAGLPLIFK